MDTPKVDVTYPREQQSQDLRPNILSLFLAHLMDWEFTHGTYMCDPKSFHTSPKKGSQGHGYLSRRCYLCVEIIGKHLLNELMIQRHWWEDNQPSPRLSPPQHADIKLWHTAKQWWALGDSWPPSLHPRKRWFIGAPPFTGSFATAVSQALKGNI